MSAIEQPTALQFPALQPPRRFLFGPGPSMVHPRVYAALSKPIVGHLDAYFIQVMADVQQLLKTAYGTHRRRHARDLRHWQRGHGSCHRQLR